MKIKRELLKNIKLKRRYIQTYIDWAIEQAIKQCWECKFHHHCMSRQFRNFKCLLNDKKGGGINGWKR